MREPAGCPPSSKDPWWAVLIYVSVFLCIAVSMYLDSADQLPAAVKAVPVVLDPSCEHLVKGQIIIESGFRTQIVRCIPL